MKVGRDTLRAHGTARGIPDIFWPRESSRLKSAFVCRDGTPLQHCPVPISIRFDPHGFFNSLMM